MEFLGRDWESEGGEGDSDIEMEEDDDDDDSSDDQDDEDDSDSDEEFFDAENGNDGEGLTADAGDWEDVTDAMDVD